jgi:type II secretion system protein H
MRREQGFTLIEALVVMLLASIVMTLAVQALRHYWLVQSLEQGEGEVISQLRQLQERAVSESHPLVYGARFKLNSSDWSIVRYNPSATPTACTLENTLTFATGVKVSAANFDAAPTITGCPGAGDSQYKFVFFFARGTATGGQLTLTQPAIGRTRTITVTPLTGRVELQ